MSSILFKRRAKMSAMADVAFMGTDEEWRRRLADAVKASGRSKRKISLAAGLGHGYVHSVLAEEKDPSVMNLVKICDELNVSLSFILFGYDIQPEAEEFLRRFQSASPKTRRALLDLLEPKP
jgi:transcriptional regulator with XRE-family HTH domain